MATANERSPRGETRPPSSRSVLLVSDDATWMESMMLTLRQVRIVARTMPRADATTAPPPPDVSIIDLRALDGDGQRLLSLFNISWPESRVILVTPCLSAGDALLAARFGALAHLAKSKAPEQLLALLAQVSPESIPSLARVERNHIDDVLARCNGNRSAAARCLGIPRRTLLRKLDKNPPRK